MAGEIQYLAAGGSGLSVVAAVFRQSDGKIWDGDSFEALADLAGTAWRITLTNQVSSYLYYGDRPGTIPTTDALSVLVWETATPAITDQPSGSGELPPVDIEVGLIDDAISGAKIATDAISNAKIADDTLSASKFLNGALTANKFGTDFITSTSVAASAVAELQSGLATAASIAALNNLSAAQVNAQCDTALSDAGVTGARMGYVDNLNIGGSVASSAEVTSIQNNTNCVRVVPEQIPIPASGTVAYLIDLYFYDTDGTSEAPDSAPTITLVNQSGTNRASRLSATTMVEQSTGHYRVTYTASDTDTEEQLLWQFSVTEGAVTSVFGNSTLVVDSVAVDFTEADRTKLEALHDDWADAGRLDTILDSRASQTSVDDLPTNAELATSQASADDATLAAIAALNNLSSAQAQTAAAAALTAYDPPTHAELTSGLGALNNLSSAQAQTAAAAALTAYDPPTHAEVTTATQAAKLASDGLDAVSVTLPNGVAANFRERVNQLWQRFFGRTTRSSTQITTYRSDNSTPATTQDYDASGQNQTVEEAVSA